MRNDSLSAGFVLLFLLAHFFFLAAVFTRMIVVYRRWLTTPYKSAEPQTHRPELDHSI